MKAHVCFLLAAVIAGGCGKTKTDVVSIPEPHVTVIGLDGEKKLVPSGELYDPATGNPAVQSVLVIDRKSNRQVFVEVDQLSAESQVDARYILVTAPLDASE